MNSLLLIAITLIQAFNLYSPDMVYQNNQLVLYSGGWASIRDIPNDEIYRSICASEYVCGTPVKVLDASPLYQINDPTLIQMPDGYWIMYYTGNTGFKNNIYFSTSWNGVLWSSPTLLLEDFWLPSATMKDGEVYLFATNIYNNWIYKFDLGASGISVGSPVLLGLPPSNTVYWINIDIEYQPSIQLWQAVAENLEVGNSSSYISYLYSLDGVNWRMGADKIIVAGFGKSVRTPAMHPNTAYFIYYGCSNTRDGMSNNICFADWR